MRFAAQVKKITEATKLLCKINGKFDRKVIMQEAWRMARQTVKNLGVGTAKEFFASCLKKVWEMAKS